MPNEEANASKTLLGGAAATGGLIVAVGVRSNRLNKVAQAEQFQANTAEGLAQQRRQMTPSRLATRAAKAGRLAKGVTKKMGVLGATAGMADTIGIVNRVEEEGGPFPARLGKFAEEWLGLPPGATQRPLTDAEKKARWST